MTIATPRRLGDRRHGRRRHDDVAVEVPLVAGGQLAEEIGP